MDVPRLKHFAKPKHEEPAHAHTADNIQSCCQSIFFPLQIPPAHDLQATDCGRCSSVTKTRTTDKKIIGDSRTLMRRPDPYVVAGVEDSAHLYALGAVNTKVNIVRADRSTPGFMCSPPVVPYIFALERAMDELAEKLGIDPVEFRRINDILVDPIERKPYSSRSLMASYDQAAEAFRWQRRSVRAGSMREGDWLIGLGCATAMYPTHIGAAAARVRMLPTGHVRVQTAAHEIGNGVYTVLAQLAAEQLGVPRMT